MELVSEYIGDFMVGTKNKLSKARKGDLIFHLVLLVWPLVQFTVFYVVVNLNSFKLAFDAPLFGKWTDNFRYIFSSAMLPEVLKAVVTSLEFYTITTSISVPFGLLFAYYIYKKVMGGKIFRFFLFLPSIISSMVMVVLFQNFIGLGMLDILKTDKILFDITSRSSYVLVILFYIWTNFGTTTLIYSNKMGELPPETIEAAQLDGVNSFQEFFYVILPFAFPTVSVFLVTGVATLFSNQYNLFSFFGGTIAFDSGTMGYYLFNLVQDYASNGIFDAVAYNRAAALSLVITLIVIPITLTIRWLTEKYGPQD